MKRKTLRNRRTSSLTAGSRSRAGGLLSSPRTPVMEWAILKTSMSPGLWEWTGTSQAIRKTEKSTKSYGACVQGCHTVAFCRRLENVIRDKVSVEKFMDYLQEFSVECLFSDGNKTP